MNSVNIYFNPLPAIIATKVNSNVAAGIKEGITLAFGGIIIYSPAVCAGIWHAINSAAPAAK